MLFRQGFFHKISSLWILYKIYARQNSKQSPWWTIFAPALKGGKEKRFIWDIIVGFGGFLFCAYWQLKGSQWLMTWGRSGRRGNATTLQPQEPFNCSQDFKCSLYELLIFSSLTQGSWCYANLRACTISSFTKFQECSVKCPFFSLFFFFCFQWDEHSTSAVSLLHRPSSSLLISS